MVNAIRAALVAALLIPSVATAGEAQTETAPAVKATAEALDPWGVESVERSGDVIEAVIPQRRIDPDAFARMVEAACSQHWFHGALEGVEELRVLSIDRGRGMVFEGGGAACEELGEVPSGALDIAIAGRSRML